MLGGVVFSVVLLLGLSVAFLSPVLAQDNSYSSKDLQNDFESTKYLSLVEIFERSEFGVVSITVTKTSPHGDSSGVGSGFIFDKEGHIITNNHVVRDGKKN